MEIFKDFQEVLDFAAEKEEEAYQLYSQAARMVTSISARKMMEDLAIQELGHKRLIQGMDRNRTKTLQITKVPDLKIGDYLVDVKYRPDMTYQEILIFAMKAEERSVRLYTSACDMTNDPDAIKMLQVLASEEKVHKFLLEALYDDKVLTEN